MGGAVRHAGNVTSAAEFNAWWDPEAVAAVLAATPLSMLPLDVTATLPLRSDSVERLAGSSSATARWCATAAAYRVQQAGYLLLHDPAAVLSVARPELFTWEAMTLECVTTGEAAGATRLVGLEGPHRVAVAADVDAVVGAVVDAILACP
jgi:inosine-uridine nucleoside N-ribohydrolase